MPIYDLLCKRCEQIEENVLVKSFDTVTHCKECGTEMKRLLSTPSFMFSEPRGTDKGRVMQINPKKAKRT